MFDFLFGWRKASKCKKLIKRVQCRLKLLKSKRACIVKQLREDVAELLKHGHRLPAFERIDQIVMDQNMVEAYDLLYNYCEFVLISLPYIRKHRDCPNDINEAVSTLIFSSSRFGELPELLSVRKLFRERYSKKLVKNALELLPGNLVSIQIKDSLEMKIVADDVKHEILDEIARSCIKKRPLLESKSQLQEKEKAKKIGLRKEGHFSNANYAIYSSSENSARLTEEVMYLDEIEEFKSPVVKDGNRQDQRLFKFKSLTDHVIDNAAEELDSSESRSSRKIATMRSLIQDSINADHAAVLVKKVQGNDHKWGHSAIKKWSLGQPCNFSAREVNKAVEVEAEELSMPRLKAGKQTLPSTTLRALPMPCRHIHPKLPDYDELAAKFMELKRANLQKKFKQLG